MATIFVHDFVPGSLRDLDQLVIMDGIGGELQITQIGIARYEVLTDDAEVKVIESEAYLVPTLNCRLVSPQRYLQELTGDAHYSVHRNFSKKVCMVRWGHTYRSV